MGLYNIFVYWDEYYHNYQTFVSRLIQRIILIYSYYSTNKSSITIWRRQPLCQSAVSGAGTPIFARYCSNELIM
jgi:hypothetical protein